MTIRPLMIAALKGLGLMLVLTAMASHANAGPPPPPSVPEVDPGSILGALTLLSGGVMLLTDRRRAKTTVS
jgi:hypothetical protein